MADDYTIQVEHDGRSFNAGIRSAEELSNGDRVRLRPRDPDREEPATGSY